MNPQLSIKPQDGDAHMDAINPFSQVVHDAATKVSRLLRQVTMWRVLWSAIATSVATWAYAEKLPTVQLAAYVPPEVSQTGMQQAFPDSEPTVAEQLFQGAVDRFIAEVLWLQESWNNVVPGTDGKTIADILNTFTPEQFVRVIAYYGAITNHPESAAMEAIIQVAPELGESRIEVDEFIDYLEEGTTGYQILLEEEWIDPGEANITPRQFYLVGQVLRVMYPERSDDVADILFNLMVNPVGHSTEKDFQLMTAVWEDGRYDIELLAFYAKYLPDHFGPAYETALKNQEIITDLNDRNAQLDGIIELWDQVIWDLRAFLEQNS